MTLRDKIVNEGYLSWYGGVDVSNNPYDEYLMHPQHELWLEGFYEAEEEWSSQ